MKILALSRYRYTDEDLSRAAHVLVTGGVVAFPTDTVYGLAVNARNPSAVARLYRLKGRDPAKPLIAFLRHPQELGQWVPRLPLYAQALINEYWPGPLTLVLPAREGTVPPSVLSHTFCLGVRAPSHPVARALVRQTPCLLATTSANVSGSPPTGSSQTVARYFGGRLDVLVEGPPPLLGQPSTVIDATTSGPRLLRRGYVSFDHVLRIARQSHRVLWVVGQRDQRDRNEASIAALVQRFDPALASRSCFVPIDSHRSASSASVSPNTDPGGLSRAPEAQSTLPTAPFLQSATLILTETGRQADHICSSYPWAASRTYALEVFAGIAADRTSLEPAIAGQVLACLRRLTSL